MDVKLTLVLKHKKQDSQPELTLEGWVYLGDRDRIRSREESEVLCQGLLHQFASQRKKRDRDWVVSSSSYELFPKH